MAIAKLVARIEARYTSFETRKTVRLTQQAEKLALTNDERTYLLQFDADIKHAETSEERTGVKAEFIPSPDAVKKQTELKAKMTKAEKAAKKAEKAIKARELKVYRRKARIAAVRYYLRKDRLVETTTILPDGTETTVKEQVPVEVQQGVEEWKKTGMKVGRFFTYPTTTFKRMWNWAKQPTDHIPAWRRPPVILRKVVTGLAIAVLAVPVHAIDLALSVVNTVVSLATGLALTATFGVAFLLYMVTGLLGSIPVVGRWIALVLNAIITAVVSLLVIAAALLGVALVAANLVIKSAVNAVIWLLSSPFLAYFKVKAMLAERKDQVDWTEAEPMVEVSQPKAQDETPAEPVVEAPKAEEEALEGNLIEPEKKPVANPRRKRRPVKPRDAAA